MNGQNKDIPVCKAAKKCGACQLSNMDYARQLKFKQANEVKLLKRFGRVSVIIGMDYPYSYRNKSQYLVKKSSSGNISTGVYQSTTQSLVVTDNCFINNKKSNQIVKYIRTVMTQLNIQPYNPKNGKGCVRHIMIRNGHKTGEYMVAMVCFNDALERESEFVSRICEKYPEIETVVLNVNKNEKMMLGSKERVLFGKGYIEDILCGKRFRISPRSFYQINPVQTEALYNTAIEFAGLSGGETILDAYCGIGTIGIAASDKALKTVGVELNEEAVKDAKVNAELNGLKNAFYYKADAAEFMSEAECSGEKFDVVFTDPPRAGCSRIFLSSLVKLSPQKIVYVSCEPKTLARDLYYLIHNGYKVRKIQPVDMFPHTHHVETVVLLSQNTKNPV